MENIAKRFGLGFHYVKPDGNMNNYFRLTGKNPKEAASAFALDETKMLWEINGKSELLMEFSLIRLFEEENGLGKSYDLSS